MAIPFNLPTDEETEENYRRLDQLLLDLYDVLRQILLRRRIQRAHRPEASQSAPMSGNQQHNSHGSHPDPSRQQQPEEQPRPDLPDLLQPAGAAAPTARKPPVPPPRRRRRRGDGKQQSGEQQRRPVSGSARNRQDQAFPDLENQQSGGPSWLNVGIELRQIAEEFRSSQLYGGEEKSRKEIKASSLFSLLVPAPITGSIWTTVIILVGWRILAARHR